MKLTSVVIKNMYSFLDETKWELDDRLSILIGPNGGGKSNLLDIVGAILRRYFVISWILKEENGRSFIEMSPEVINRMPFPPPHDSDRNRLQHVELEMQVTMRDIEALQAIKDDARELREQLTASHNKYGVIEQGGYPNQLSLVNILHQAEQWDLLGIKSRDYFGFKIVQGELQELSSPEHGVIRSYLYMSAAVNILRRTFGRKDVDAIEPMLFFSANRSSDGFQTEVNLSGFNEGAFKRNVDCTTSRQYQDAMQLVFGRIYAEYNKALDQGKCEAETSFRKLSSSLQNTLKKFGYEICGFPIRKDPNRNIYDIELKKEDDTLILQKISTGEAQLLRLLFTIYGLNVRDALVVIDEPELHLHPAWQNALLGMFETMSEETGNQFLLATHSPVFVSPESVQHVSRVYLSESADGENRTSKITNLSTDGQLPEKRHLFSIVNSQNNERIFFTEKVILVEGISDRLFFEAMFSHKMSEKKLNQIRRYEVVSVDGKQNFPYYEELLEKFEVDYIIIADLDHLKERTEDEEVKSLLKTDWEKMREKTTATSSKDGAELFRRLDSVMQKESLTEQDRESFRDLWEYIKGRYVSLPKDLKGKKRILREINEMRMREKKVFILKRGSIETYLPDGYRGNDNKVKKMIEFLENDRAFKLLPERGAKELEEISDLIFPNQQPEAEPE